MHAVNGGPELLERGACNRFDMPVTYKLVGVDKAVDWARKNFKKGLEIVKKMLKKCTK